MAKQKNKAQNYFCVCPNCGSLEWLDTAQAFEEFTNPDIPLPAKIVNKLNRDGTIFTPNDYRVMVFEINFCADCESPVRRIPFSEFPLEERKRVASLTEKERIAFSKSFLVMKELTKDKEKEKEEKGYDYYFNFFEKQNSINKFERNFYRYLELKMKKRPK